MHIFTSNTPEETKKIAKDIFAKFPEVQIFLLTGELGSGKTTFSKGIAGHLGIEEKKIKSPTYTLMREYETEPGLMHVDLYRLTDHDQIITDQIQSHVEQGGIALIEWPEIALEFLPSKHVHIDLKVDGDGRTITVIEND